MEVRYASNPSDVKHFDTERLRSEFLAQKLMQEDKLNLVYSHYDRFIIGCCMPINPVKIESVCKAESQLFP
jgi:4-deoxy-L-threo-5-hexosulose-uronate ketol-isomerase